MITRSQIRALRATTAALLAQLEALEDQLPQEPTPECQHPEDSRDPRVNTFDQPGRWMCRRCGFIGGETAAAKE